MRWVQPPLPEDVRVFIGGQLCVQDDDEEEEFTVRKYKGEPTKVSVRIEIDNEPFTYPDAFTWCLEPQVSQVIPSFGATRGEETSIAIETSKFEGPITKVHIDGQECKFDPEKPATSTHCVVYLPPGRQGGCVDVQVWASDQTAKLAAGFQYYVPDYFECAAKNIALSPDGFAASRLRGVNHALCIGHGPLDPVGIDAATIYYEIIVEEVAGGDQKHATNMKAIAVGFTSQSAFEAIPEGSTPQDVEALSEVWMCGYEQRGALALTRLKSKTSTSPLKGWRPAVDLTEGMRIGVMSRHQDSSDGAGREMIIIVAGQVKARAPMEGVAPFAGLRPVVEVLGRAVKVAFIQKPELPHVT